MDEHLVLALIENHHIVGRAIPTGIQQHPTFGIARASDKRPLRHRRERATTSVDEHLVRLAPFEDHHIVYRTIAGCVQQQTALRAARASEKRPLGEFRRRETRQFPTLIWTTFQVLAVVDGEAAPGAGAGVLPTHGGVGGGAVGGLVRHRFPVPPSCMYEHPVVRPCLEEHQIIYVAVAGGVQQHPAIT